MMILGLMFMVLSAVVFFVSKQQVDAWYTQRRDEMDKEHQEIVTAYEFARDKSRQLKKRKRELEDELTLVRYGQEVNSEFQPEEKKRGNAPDRAAQWLLKNKKLTMEEYSKAKDKADRGGVSFLAACEMLGFVTNEEASSIRNLL